MHDFAVVIVILTFLLGLFLLLYWTCRLIMGAIYYNKHTLNAAPASICLMLSIVTAGAALIASMGVWQIYAGLYS